MVANLTHLKSADAQAQQRLADVAETMQQIKDRLLAGGRRGRGRLRRLFGRLAAAFDYARGKGSSPSAACRRGSKRAIEVPYQTAITSFDAMQAAREMVETGLAASITDAAVGCQIAMVGVRGGLWNVMVNLKGVQDPPYVKKCASSVTNYWKKQPSCSRKPPLKLTENWRRPLSRVGQPTIPCQPAPSCPVIGSGSTPDWPPCRPARPPHTACCGLWFGVRAGDIAAIVPMGELPADLAAAHAPGAR